MATAYMKLKMIRQPLLPVYKSRTVLGTWLPFTEELSQHLHLSSSGLEQCLSMPWHGFDPRFKGATGQEVSDDDGQQVRLKLLGRSVGCCLSWECPAYVRRVCTYISTVHTVPYVYVNQALSESRLAAFFETVSLLRHLVGFAVDCSKSPCSDAAMQQSSCISLARVILHCRGSVE